MNNSTSIDVNYLSGDVEGWVMVDGQGSHFVPFPDDGRLFPDHPESYTSILKLTGRFSGVLDNLEVGQGSECSVDINNHANATLHGSFGVSEERIGNQIFSVKGGSIATISGILKGSGNRLNADVLVDNWSDQSYEPSTVDLSNAVHETGRKIRVVYRIGSSRILGSNVNRLVFSSLKLTAYWWLKWSIRKLVGIKVGQRGPSWI